MNRHSVNPGPVVAHAWMALVIALIPLSALAYVGPGAGLSAIGSFLALIAALFLALVGFIWYPVKRLLRRNKHPKQDVAGGVDAGASADDLPADVKPHTPRDS